MTLATRQVRNEHHGSENQREATSVNRKEFSVTHKLIVTAWSFVLLPIVSPGWDRPMESCDRFPDPPPAMAAPVCLLGARGV